MAKQIVLVDAHIHVYPVANVPVLLDAAAANFAAAAKRLGATAWDGVLLLTETVADNWFDAMEAAGVTVLGDWTIAPNANDPVSLMATRGTTTVRLVAGRQIVTAERLEVHAFGTREKFADGGTTRATIDAVRAKGAIAVLPWGVGKWVGGRGQLLEQLLAAYPAGSVFIADNGGRPAFWPDARLGLTLGRLVFRGSDPLPLPGEERRAGEFGSWLEGSLAPSEPVNALLQRMTNSATAQAFGRAENPWRFFRNQLWLRLRKF